MTNKEETYLIHLPPSTNRTVHKESCRLHAKDPLTEGLQGIYVRVKEGNEV